MSGMIDSALAVWQSLPEMLRFVIVVLVKIVVVLIPLILSVAYFTYWERKILAWMHVRIGPNRVGWKGLLQPFADVIKMLLKEIVIPTNSNKFLFLIAPVLSLVPAFAVWAVVPFEPQLRDREHRRGAAVRARAHVARRLRRHPRGLGVELEVRVPRCDALGGADRRVRDRDGLRARRRADGERAA